VLMDQYVPIKVAKSAESVNYLGITIVVRIGRTAGNDPLVTIQVPTRSGMVKVGTASMHRCCCGTADWHGTPHDHSTYPTFSMTLARPHQKSKALQNTGQSALQ
jgi:hypothetical protein